jgi:hypothetical protein
MPRIVRGILWVVKGVLLVIALGAIVLWPLSYGHEWHFDCQRVAVQTERIDVDGYEGGWSHGEFGVRKWRQGYAGDFLSEGRNWEVEGPNWHWFQGYGPPVIFWAPDSLSRWGPFRWRYFDGDNSGESATEYVFCFPCWFLSLFTSLWPLTSLTLLHRRRARLRRLARAGCCNQCGYDLRATAEKSGPLLARCPECGAESAR